MSTYSDAHLAAWIGGEGTSFFPSVNSHIAVFWFKLHLQTWAIDILPISPCSKRALFDRML